MAVLLVLVFIITGCGGETATSTSTTQNRALLLRLHFCCHFYSNYSGTTNYF